MTLNQMDPLFKNYQALVRRLDDHILTVQETFPDQIACKKGCDTCCKFLSLFPVEAFSLSKAFMDLPESIKDKVTQKMKKEKNACPLLIDRECVLYPARPIICRTHGYPIFMEKGGDILIDFCPDNFKGIVSFPKKTMLDIEQLNTLLSAINRHFIESVETDPPLMDRIPVSDALFIFCA